MAGWDFPLTVESSRGIGGRDDPDNLLGGLATLPPDIHEEPEWGASSWADEPVEKDGTPPPAQPEREHRRVTAIEEASVAGVFEELLHPRDRAGKWAVKSVKGADSTDHSAHLLSLKGAPDSLTLHSPNGQLTPEREALHRKIIKRALEGTTPQEHPRALFTAGGAASGKSSLIDQLEVPKGHVYVNPDTIKEQLPEFQKLKDAGHKDIAAAQMHEESSHIAAQIAAHAMRTKRHVVIDGVGDSGSRKFVGKLQRAAGHGHEVTVRYAHVPLDVALQREKERRARSGRAVPHDVLRGAHLEVAARYHDEVQHLHGVKVEVYDTNQPNRGAPKLIHHIRPTGEVETHDAAKYQEFLDKRHPPKTAIEEGEFEPSLHPRDRLGEFAHLPHFHELPDAPIDEPPLPDAKRVSTGVVLKDGGKLWVFEPKGHFGGYEHTFPKGVLEPGLTPQQNAHKELHEETGLTGRITGHLGDYQGTTGVTRYYTAERTGGTPHGPDATPFVEGGRESAAVKLVTPEEAATMLNMPRDQQILADLQPTQMTYEEKVAQEYRAAIDKAKAEAKALGHDYLVAQVNVEGKTHAGRRIYKLPSGAIAVRSLCNQVKKSAHMSPVSDQATPVTCEKCAVALMGPS